MIDKNALEHKAGFKVGFRDWQTAAPYFLMDRGRRGVILPGKRLVASCYNYNHFAPSLDCSCGIYAHNLEHPDTSISLPNMGSGTAWGLVALWGEIIVYSKGYRAQYAYPLKLFIPEEKERGNKRAGELGLTQLREIAAIYQVPLIPWKGSIEEEAFMRRSQEVIRIQQEEILLRKIEKVCPCCHRIDWNKDPIRKTNYTCKRCNGSWDGKIDSSYKAREANYEKPV